jgi:hypothetical protein
MTTRIIGGITVNLGTGPIHTSYGHSDFDGTPTARLQLGPDLVICASSATPETLRALEEAIAELRTWSERQARLAVLPEVA